MRLDLIQQVLAAHALDEACRAAFGCDANEVRRRAEIGNALAAWGAAIKRFVFKCVTPNGRTDAHGSYVADSLAGPRCFFCGELLT